jgi:large subunit ribosomal protein L21
VFAIVYIGGFQERVEKGSRLRVPSIRAGVEETVALEKVLLFHDGSNVTVGKPWVPGIKVEAKVLSHGRGPKVRVFTFKKRKRCRRTMGHRQGYTEVEIMNIG